MATLIGESTFNGTNGSHFRARIYLDSYTQSTENNSTTAVRHLYMQSFDGYSGYGATIAGYIDGVQTGSTSSIDKNSVVDMGTSTITVTHNNDGVGSVSFNSSINASAWGLGTANIYASWTPPSIARSAKITAPSNASIEETIKLNINRLVDTYNYTLRYKFTGDTQDYEGTIVENINQDSYDWTIPEEFYQYWKENIPTKNSRYCYVYCDTYSGTTLIGTTEAVIQILTLSKTTPTFETYNFADQKAATRALTGDPSIMVAGYSVGRLEFTCKLDYYSKVYQVQNILTQEDIPYTVVSNTDKTQVIKVEMFITDFNTFYPIWVFDGRGRAARIIVRTPEQQKPINYTYITYTRIDYIPLTANITWLKRPSATTGEVTIGFSGNYWNGNFGTVDNELSLNWKYRIKGATDWTTGGTFTKDTDYTITNNTYESKGNISLGTVFDYRNVYEVGLFYADKLVDTFTSKIVPKGFPIFWWNKDGVYDGNNKKFLVEGDTPAVKNEYTTSTTDTYSCNYINSHNLKPSIIHYVTPTVGSNYEPYGNMPSPEFPSEVQSVGDLVTDETSEYYGKYDVPITVNDETKHIYLDEPLRKIGDYADYIDFKNQKVIRQTTFRTFDGTEKFSSYSTAKGFYYVNSDMKSQKFGYGYCNYYLRIKAVKDVGIRFGVDNNSLYFCNVYTDAEPLTVAGWKEKLSNWNANGNPLIVYYILDTPTEESITVPGLTIPNSEVTNVLAGTAIQPSSMDVTYYQDINKVITELKSVILAQGGNV